MVRSLGLAAVLLACAPIAWGQVPYRNGFEGAEVSWRDLGGDARYQIDLRRVEGNAHSGDWAEQVRLTAQNGTYVHIGHDVGEATVIEELRPSIWIRADRGGVQLLARVVLPRVVDPKTRQPVTAFLRGTQYGMPGEWEQLRIDDAYKQVQRLVPVLQAQLGQQAVVDPRGAFIDRIVLNVYGGQGATRAWIDDLEIAGYVRRAAPQAGAEPNPPAARSPGKASLASISDQGGDDRTLSKNRPRVALSGAVLTIDDQPSFVRAIRHQGESLAMLRQMGFDAALIDRTASPELLREAIDADLWLIAPPPIPPAGAAGGTPPLIGPAYDRVLMWNLGRGLRHPDVRPLAERASLLRTADRQTSRPTWCQAEDELEGFGRHVDIQANRMAPLSTSIEMKDYGNWLTGRARLVRPGSPAWALIQTEVVESQMTEPQTADAPETTGGWRPASHAQIRLAVYTAVSAGARGLLFESQSRLDGTDLGSKSRARTLELLNLELDLLSPFAAGGSYSTNAIGGDPNIGGAVLISNRARLVIPLWSGPGGQYVAGQVKAEETSIVVPGVPEATDVYEVSPAGLRTLKHQRVAGGVRVPLRDFGLATQILFSKDPGAIAQLRRKTQDVQRRAANLARDVAMQELGLVEGVSRRLAATQPVPPQSVSRLAAARANLEGCDRALGSGDFQTAYFEARRALRPLQQLERLYWDDAVRGMGTGTPLTSPYCGQFATLVEHWAFVDRLRVAKLGANRLEGGDFEDFAALPANGWENVKYPIPGIAQGAEFSTDDPRAGRTSLKLSARPVDPKTAPDLLENPPLWIVSGPAPVEAGRWMRIHGWVRIPGPIQGSVEGLTIVDSLGGTPLALRFGKTDGWRDFTMFRRATKSGEMFVTFILTGLGEVYLDDVTIDPVEM